MQRGGHASFLRTILGVVVCLLAAVPPMTAQTDVSDAAVQKAIKTLRKRLLLAQQPDGSWLYNNGERYITGHTALMLMALRQAGVAKDNPAVQLAVTYIRQHNDQLVYSEALVICALETVDPEKHTARIRAATEYLTGGQSGGGTERDRRDAGGPRARRLPRDALLQ